MMTAKERSISPYEERGSEASMTDSLGIKDAAKESCKGQSFNVHGALGIHPNATMEGNVAGFKPMNVNTGEVTYSDVVVWLKTMSEIGGSRLGDFAEEYAHKFVVQAEMTNGWQWLAAPKEFWLQHFKKAMHYTYIM